MAFNPNLPVTAGNCPTRAALERKPGDKGFLTQSIGAKHTAKKKQQRALNLQRRAGSKP